MYTILTTRGGIKILDRYYMSGSRLIVRMTDVVATSNIRQCFTSFPPRKSLLNLMSRLASASFQTSRLLASLSGDLHRHSPPGPKRVLFGLGPDPSQIL